ncbi:nicotinamidase-related amidase [Roseovarius sp. MBR-78]|uniref:isochorismatase family protein n=1 Tax=Roseovarius sp. MBR-78 TaxID=3156460 RepID=UPI0033998145
MPLLSVTSSHLLLIDFQARLMPAIAGGAGVVAQAGKLLAGARIMGVARSFTEQIPAKLGHTIADLAAQKGEEVLAKSRFDACPETGLATRIAPGHRIVVAGCEAHVCVLQTVLGLLDAGREVVVVEDATGSRAPDNRAAALARMGRAGAEIVTTEMVLFEWLGGADHPAFREVIGLIK